MAASRNADRMADLFHIIERYLDRRVLTMVDRDHGFEGKLTAVSRTPPGIWLSDAEAVIFRSTLANPLPQIVSRHKRSELFINLTSIQRLEVLSD